MAYVYRHIRLDTNKPFYIGVGIDDAKFTEILCTSGTDFNRIFRRANETTARNKEWKKIVSQTDYEVEILEFGLTLEEALKKEIEFIKLYGRADMGNGILCNMKYGGGGFKAKERNENVRKNISERLKKLHLQEGYTNKMVKTRIKNFGKKIVQKDLFGNTIKIWDYIGEIVRNLKKENPDIKISRPNILHCLSGKRKTAGGFKWERL